MNELEEESFSSKKDAALSNAAVADEALVNALQYGIAYAVSIVIIFLLTTPSISWNVLVVMVVLWLPARDYLKAKKRKNEAYQIYFKLKENES